MAAVEKESSSEASSGDEFDFEEQLRLERLEKERLISSASGEQVPTYTDADGAIFEWDASRKAWFPKVDEDFMAHYQASYGVAYDYDSMPAPKINKPVNTAPNDETDQGKPQQTDDGKKRKRKKDKTDTAQSSTTNTWFDVAEDKNTSVYVSNVPSDFTDEEFLELMQKCGLVLLDPFNKNPKIKLYRNEDGSLKGDGRCCYIKVESVALALQILDGWALRENKVLHVERAKFELKGDGFDTTKRKRKLTNKEKQRIKERQEKLFDWRPEKLEIQRGRHERIAVIKFMFTPEELDTDPDLFNIVHDDVKEEATKAGAVKRIIICDRNPEGVVLVHFKVPEEADKCILAMNGRFYAGRKLEAVSWDGKTKYQIEETEEERAQRLEKWYNFLEQSTQQTGDNDDEDKVEVPSTTSDIDAASITTIPPSSDVSSVYSDDQSLDTTASIAGSEVDSIISVDSSLNGDSNGNGNSTNGSKRATFRNADDDLSDNSDDEAAFESTDEEDNA